VVIPAEQRFDLLDAAATLEAGDEGAPTGAPRRGRADFGIYRGGGRFRWGLGGPAGGGRGGAPEGSPSSHGAPGAVRGGRERVGGGVGEEGGRSRRALPGGCPW